MEPIIVARKLMLDIHTGGKKLVPLQRIDMGSEAGGPPWPEELVRDFQLLQPCYRGATVADCCGHQQRTDEAIVLGGLRMPGSGKGDSRLQISVRVEMQTPKSGDARLFISKEGMRHISSACQFEIPHLIDQGDLSFDPPGIWK